MFRNLKQRLFFARGLRRRLNRTQGSTLSGGIQFDKRDGLLYIRPAPKARTT